MSLNQNGSLPTYALYIHPQQLQELRNDIWSDEFVPAKLTVGKKKYEIDITYRGALTRKFKKKPYHIEFIKPGMFYNQREIHLNAEYNDPSLMRSKLSFDFFKSLGNLTPEARYVFLTINGSKQGVYLQLESVDDLFLLNRDLPKGSIHYASNDDANFSLLNPDNNEPKKSLLDGYTRKYGEEQDDDDILRTLIYKINTTPVNEFGREITKYIDIDKYLLWLSGIICTQNYDGFIQNYALYFNKHTELYQMIPWDYDGTWGRDVHGRVMDSDYIPIQGYNTLTSRILDVADFSKRYRLLLEEILETKFTRQELEPTINSLHQKLRPYLILDPFKKKQLDHFDAELDYILEFITNRNTYLKDHLSELE